MENTAPLLECQLNYILYDKSGTESERGEAQATLDPEHLTFLPQYKDTLYISYRDILNIIPLDYTIDLILVSKEKFHISELGYKYEDFLKLLIKLRNELLLKDMLMNESVKKAGIESEFVYCDESGTIVQQGVCEPRLYETALVLMPEQTELIRIMYSDIVDIHDEDYKIIIDIEDKHKYVIAKLGKEFEPFKKAMADAMNALIQQVQTFLKEIISQLDPSKLRQAAKLMREGKAAKKRDLDAISPQIWVQLEKRIASAGIKENYEYLKSISQPEDIAIGIKRGLLGDLTGEYLWILFPIYSLNKSDPGNAIAMESVDINTAEPEEELDPETSGKATYFFRLTGRQEYSKYQNIDQLQDLTTRFISQINRSMREINFRREPVYFSEDRLSAPENIRYYFAVQKLAGLRNLRDLFIGRVIHATPEQWQQDIKELLQFNISTADDSIKWKK
ncbi:MAG: hypothetical protein ACE14V_05105 [bacterium]